MQLYKSESMESPLSQMFPDTNLSPRSTLSSDINKVDVQVRRLSVVHFRNRRLAATDLTHVARNLKARFSRRSQLIEDGHHHRQEEQLLLDTVDADFPSGTITAIIGASGSGKTTLLNAIAGRLPAGTSVTQGMIRWNSGLNEDGVRLAYLTQHDVLIPTLTVRETLTYAADLRLPASTGPIARQKLVQDIIEELHLGRCADTPVGDEWKRGCSGGEKRRVSIGVQLLSNPPLLLLDEPTTGLDAANALSVVQALRQLAARGRTIVVTLHQPRMEIWSLVDNAVILARGMPVYAGAVSGSLSWLQAQGLTRPDFVNAADFIIDVTAVDNRSAEAERVSGGRVKNLQAAWRRERDRRFSLERATTCELDRTVEKNLHLSTGDLSFKAGCTLVLRQLNALIFRTAKVTYRDRLGMTASIMEAVLIGLTVGYIFLHLGDDQAGIRARQGCLYVTASLQGYLILIFETYRLSSDMPIFEAEQAEHCVNPYTFVLSRRLARLLTEDIPVPLILSCLIYFMAGFDAAAGKFGIFLAITIANHYVAISCATACVAVGRDFARSSLIASVIYTLQSLASGMIIQIDTIPAYIRWTRWIMYTYYTFSAYAGNEFEGSVYTCPSSRPEDCVSSSGDFIMMSLVFPLQWTRKAIGVLVVFILVFGLASILGFSYVRPMSLRRAYTPSMQPEASVPLTSLESSSAIFQRHHLSVGLDRVSVGLRKRSVRSLGRWGPTRNIVGPLTLTFDEGMLNVVLGPSGSGKSSLLGAIGRRLSNVGKFSYILSGTISLGGLEVSNKVFRLACSLVPQEDEMLLPALTVRETLHYAAALRLPTSISDEKRHEKVEDVLRRMGLAGCANSLVGSGGTSFRGISGGEKRRLTLAVQMLTDPQVLLVDEPTSGLDAFTALTILQLLHNLAKEGRTVIVTVHQPRSDMFDLFGNILLLDREGGPAYFGRAENLVDHLATCGYECPSAANPADFALDVVSHEGSLPFYPEPGKAFEQSTVSLTSHSDTEVHQGQQQQKESFFGRGLRSTNVLIRRATTNMRRQGRLLMARGMQPTGAAILFALFFAGLDNDYRSLQTRLGFYQQLGGFYVIGMLTNAAVYPDERDLARRETEDAAYAMDSFLMAYTVVELPFEIASSLFFGLLSIFAVGFPRDVATYVAASLACFTGLSCGESLGIIFHTLLPTSAGFAINLMGVSLVVANTIAGILVIDMPSIFVAMNYLSPIRYQVHGLAYYTLRGIVFDCPFEEGSCPLSSGEEVLELYGFDGSPLVSMAGMVACIVVYRLLAWLVIRALG